MTETLPLRAGVIGAGVFGGYHAGKYAAHEAVTLTAIYDIDFSRAQALAKQFNCKACKLYGSFLEAVDMATVTSPAIYHAGLARPLLLAGKSVLIEKPLAARLADGEALVDLANESGAVLAAGHQERLVFDAIGLLNAPERPLRIEAARMGMPTTRCLDVSVTLDLMIHDIDLVLACLGAEMPDSLTAKAQRVYSDNWDVVKAAMQFGETEVELIASRAHEQRERYIDITYPSGRFRLDFVNHTFENNTGFDLNENFADSPAGKDALGLNVSRFIDAVRDKSKRPAISGEAGLRALKLALAIDAAAS